MAGPRHRNNQLAGKSITFATSFNEKLIERKEVDLEFIKKHPVALELISRIFDNVKGKYYDGTSPSRVVGTEITRIGNLDKDELAKQGIIAGWQGYIVVGNKNRTETGLPSYVDKETGEKKLVDLNKLDVSKIVELLESLPEGTTIAIVFQMDVNRTNDVDLNNSIVTKLGGMTLQSPNNNMMLPFTAPKPIGDGAGFFSGNGGTQDSTTMQIEPSRDSGEGRVVSISEILLFKGTKEDPVDLGTIAQGLTQGVRSFDGTPITLSDLQNFLFILPVDKTLAPDAHGRITFDSDIRVGLLEVISKQQMNYSQRNALTDSFNYEGGQDRPGSPAAPIAETIMSSTDVRNPSSLPRAKDTPMEESMLMRLLMNPVERRLWGRMYGLPDEESSSAFSAPAQKRGGNRPYAKTIFSSGPKGQNLKNTLNVSGGKSVSLSKSITKPISEQLWKPIKAENHAYKQDERPKKEAAANRKTREAAINNFTKARGTRFQSQRLAMTIRGKKTLAKNTLTDEKTRKKKGQDVFARKKEASEPKAEKRFERKKDSPVKEKPAAKRQGAEEAEKKQMKGKEKNRKRKKTKTAEDVQLRKKEKAKKEEMIAKKPAKKTDSPRASAPWKKSMSMNPYFYNQMLGLTSRKTRAGSSSGKRRLSGP